MPIPSRSDRQRGFSLIELLIAIVITLIVTGSIYGLLATGQNAFRREPDISDRQQQIRVAMDLIQRDITTAGMGMTEWIQVFTPDLDAQGPPNAQGVASDFLELFGNDGACANVNLCNTSGASYGFKEDIPVCYTFPGLVVLSPGFGGVPGSSSIACGNAPVPKPGTDSCEDGNGVENYQLTFPAACRNWNPPPGQVSPVVPPGTMSRVQIVRYEIAVDANGIPSLWRSDQGGWNLGINCTCPGTVGPGPGGGSGGWQIVASGIEDLQVQYRDGTGFWVDDAPVIVLPPGTGPTEANWQTITREVKVTLTARTTGQANLQGESYSVTGVAAIRGQLTSVTSPRAALFALSLTPPTSPQHWE